MVNRSAALACKAGCPPPAPQPLGPTAFVIYCNDWTENTQISVTWQCEEVGSGALPGHQHQQRNALPVSARGQATQANAASRGGEVRQTTYLEPHAHARVAPQLQAAPIARTTAKCKLARCARNKILDDRARRDCQSFASLHGRPGGVKLATRPGYTR